MNTVQKRYVLVPYKYVNHHFQVYEQFIQTYITSQHITVTGAAEGASLAPAPLAALNVCICVFQPMLPCKDNYLCHWNNFNKVCIQSVCPLIPTCWEITYFYYLLLIMAITRWLQAGFMELWGHTPPLLWLLLELGRNRGREFKWGGGWVEKRMKRKSIE